MTRKNVELTTEASGDTAFLCPGCGFWNLHQCGVEVFDRHAEDSAAGRHTTVRHESGPMVGGRGDEDGSVEIDDDLSENPSSRRDGIKIHFECEHCSPPGGSDTYELNIVQHKGEEKVYWQVEVSDDE